MARKPQNITYGVNDHPPIWVTILLAFQHIFVLSSTIMLPAVLIQAIGGTYLQINSLVAFSMIAAAIGTVVQALRWGPLGSGYLLPNLCGPAYLSISLQAAWLGGLPLMHGMILIAGVFEALFSQVIHHLRKLFPPEIAGLVVLMVGISLIPLAASKFVGIEYVGGKLNPTHIILSIIILCLMIGVNLWAPPKLKLYGVLIGMLVGYVLSLIFGFLTQTDLNNLQQSHWFALPGQGVPFFKFSFDASLVLPFIIVSIVGALKTFGNLSTVQKINDADWQQPNTKNISRGMLADSISVMMSGLLGGMATDSSSSNVGLSLATGATSRVIAFVIGILFALFAFSPKITGVFSIMPSPVVGAILVFVTSFMVLSGFQIILHTQPDTKKVFIIGIAFIFGLSSSLMSGLYSFVPSWLGVIFSSPLTLATLIAILLNIIFNFDQLFKRN
jgi:NCS2 family nucleobase:cation symporter-2